MKKDKEKLQKRSVKVKLKHYIEAIIPVLSYSLQPLFDVQPYWGLVFYNAISIIGLQMSLNKNDMEEIVTFIQDNPNVFSKEIVTSDEFKRAFVGYLETYLKLRLTKKKKILNKILVGYSIAENPSEFYLESFEACLLRISPTTLDYLVFLKSVILPIKDADIRKMLERGTQQYTELHDFTWWYNGTWRREDIWRYLSKWYHDNYNPNSDLVKKKYNIDSVWPTSLVEQVFDVENKKRQESNTAIEELVALGILKLQLASGSGVSMTGGSVYDFSTFGYQFLKYIDEVNLPDFIDKNY